ncbi:MAG: hypothetical protein U0610_27260 [bacterium]
MAGPIVFHDELAPIGLARYLRLGAPIPHVGVPFYPAYGGLLALVSPDVLDPASAHAAARAVNACLLAVSFLATLALARHLFEREPSRTERRVVALAACLHAPLLLAGHLALPDNALVAGGVVAMLLVARALERPSTARVAAAGVTLGLLPLIHVRALPVVMAGVVGWGWGALHAEGAASARRRSGVVFASALVAGLVIAWLGAAALARVAPPPIAMLSRAHTVARVSNRSFGEFAPRLPFVIAGHGLYLGLSTFGLVWIAFALGVRRVWRSGVGADATCRARGAVALAIVLASAGTWAMSAVFFNTGVHRPDHVLSGRYNEAALLPLLALGVAAVLERAPVRSAWAWGRTALAAGVGTAALGALATQVVRFAPFDHPFNPATVLALIPWLGADGVPDLWRITGVGGVLAAAGVALALARPRIFVGAWIACALVLEVTISNRYLVPGSRDRARQRVVADALARIAELEGPVACVAIDCPSWSLWHAHHYQFLRPLQRFELFDSRKREHACSDLIVSADRNLAAAYPGARVIARERGDVERLWVLPGEQQARLAAAGFLEPPTWGAMPTPAFRSELAWLVAPPGRISARAPRSLAVLRVTHLGGDSPWLSAAELGDVELAVRVGVRWFDASGGGRPVAEAHLDLPHALLPGERVDITVPLPGDGVRLPPGRYRVVVGLLQEGVRWFRDVRDGVLEADLTAE